MASLRAFTQKPAEILLSQISSGNFDLHDIKHGTQEDFVYQSTDYKNLFNLVTHSEHRSIYDIVTKHIIAAIIVVALKGVGYFPKLV